MGETGCDIWGKGGVSANYLLRAVVGEDLEARAELFDLHLPV